MTSFCDAKVVADYLGVRLNYVYEKAAAFDRGDPDGLPSYKRGGLRRFKIEEVEAWMRGTNSKGVTESLS